MAVDCSQKEDRKMEGDQSQVLEALKRRIRDLENETKGVSEEKFVCLICMVRNYEMYELRGGCFIAKFRNTREP